MSYYKFRHLVSLDNIDPTHFGGRDHLVSAVQYQDIIKNDENTPTTTVSERREIEKKQ